MTIMLYLSVILRLTNRIKLWTTTWIPPQLRQERRRGDCRGYDDQSSRLEARTVSPCSATASMKAFLTCSAFMVVQSLVCHQGQAITSQVLTHTEAQRRKTTNFWRSHVFTSTINVSSMLFWKAMWCVVKMSTSSDSKARVSWTRIPSPLWQVVFSW